MTPEPDLPGQLIEATMQLLETVGWCSHGPRDFRGGKCVIIAMGEAYYGMIKPMPLSSAEKNNAYRTASNRIMAENGNMQIPDWNDHVCNDYWEDVHPVLKRARDRTEL